MLIISLVIAAASLTHGHDTNEPPLDRWAALAIGTEWFDGTTGNLYVGRAYSEPSELSAKDAAIGACAYEGCEIKVDVETGCIGISKGHEDAPIYREWTGFAAVHFDGEAGATIAERKSNTRSAAGEA